MTMRILILRRGVAVGCNISQASSGASGACPLADNAVLPTLQASSVKDNSAVNPAHVAEDCNRHSDPFVRNRTRHQGKSRSPMVQPIAALADLPLPNPNFGYRSHFSVDGGKSGYVVVRSAVYLSIAHSSGSGH